VWVIRGGEDNGMVDAFVAEGVIGVGYPDVPDGRTVDRWDVTERLRLRGWTVPESRAEMFELFVRGMSLGDIVVMPDTPRRDVVLGRVEGDYEFAAHLDADDHRHRREVAWFGRHAVDLLPAGVRDLTRQRQAISERSTPGFVEHAEAVERGELGRVATDTAPAARPMTPRAASSPKTPRALRAPKAPVVPKAVVPAGRVCPGCFLRKSDAQFPPASEVCGDCQ
jgi:hypothetical protein